MELRVENLFISIFSVKLAVLCLRQAQFNVGIYGGNFLVSIKEREKKLSLCILNYVVHRARMLLKYSMQVLRIFNYSRLRVLKVFKPLRSITHKYFLFEV